MSYSSTSVLDANAVPRAARSITRSGIVYPLSACLPGPGIAGPGRQGMARMAGGLDADAAAANYGNNAAITRSYLGTGNYNRVRFTGPVRRARLYLQNVGSITTLRITLWRKISTLYYPVGRSADLVGALAGTQINDIWLPTPLMAVAGDYIGLELVTNTTGYQWYLHTTTSHAVYYIAGGIPTGEGDNLSGWSTIASRYLPVELYGDSPTFAWLGHSQAAGHPLSYSAIELSSTWDPTSDPGALLAASLPGSTSSNAGVGSELAATTAARAVAVLGNARPAFAIALTGINDVSGGSVDFAAYAAAAAAIAQAALMAGSIPVWIAMLPNTAESNAHMSTRDIFTAAAIAALEAYPAIVVNAETALGQYRAGGDPGNLWDLQGAYNSGDGVHPNAAGYAVLAAQVLAALPIP